MPWKNGGGVTTEILAWPPAAGLDAFDWRISMAKVASAGPFSQFFGIDRTLTVLEGTMRLAVEGAGELLLTPQSAPFAFPGDVATSAELVGGAVLDFNVMTRRGRFAHRVSRLDISQPTEIDTGEGACLVFLASGSVQIALGDESVEMTALDTLCFDRGPAPLNVSPACPSSLLEVIIRPL